MTEQYSIACVDTCIHTHMNTYIHTYIVFIQCSVRGHLGRFHVLAVVNSARWTLKRVCLSELWFLWVCDLEWDGWIAWQLCPYVFQEAPFSPGSASAPWAERHCSLSLGFHFRACRRRGWFWPIAPSEAERPVVLKHLAAEKHPCRAAWCPVAQDAHCPPVLEGVGHGPRHVGSDDPGGWQKSPPPVSQCTSPADLSHSSPRYGC